MSPCCLCSCRSHYASALLVSYTRPFILHTDLMVLDFLAQSHTDSPDNLTGYRLWVVGFYRYADSLMLIAETEFVKHYTAIISIKRSRSSGRQLVLSHLK
jgi:hypothetical protein